MIICVNANPAVDHVLFIDSLETRGTIRAKGSLDCVGGKGADVALVLAKLGAEHCLVSFMAGEYGQILKGLYKAYQIKAELIWVEGETRVVTVIIETANCYMTQISQSGFEITEGDSHSFMNAIRRNTQQNDWIIASGSLPPNAPKDFYKQVTNIAHCAGAQILIDAQSGALLEAIPAVPNLIKLNWKEYIATFGLDEINIPAISKHAHDLLEENHFQAIIITLGEEGILLVSSSKVYHAVGAEQIPVNPAGAGDAVSAALVHRLTLGDPWEVALRWACAAGMAVTLTEATADCEFGVIELFLPQIEITTKIFGN